MGEIEVRRSRALGIATMGLSVACLALASSSAFAQVNPESAASKLGHVISGNCVKCHNAEDWAGGLALDTLDFTQPAKNAEIWEAAASKLRGRLMPPAGADQPSQADIDALVKYIESSVDAAADFQRAGHVPLQRLNRTEFASSVRGLVGVDVDPKQTLPTEIEVEGFSNIAGALGISPSFTEQYLSAARRVAKRAVGEPIPKLAATAYPASSGGQSPRVSQTQANHVEGFPLGTRGGMRFTHVFPADGEYRFDILDADNVAAGLYPGGMETAATMLLLIDGKEVARKEIGGPDDLALTDRDGPVGRAAIVRKLTLPAQVAAGKHEVIATFIERSWAMSNDTTGGGRVSGMPLIKGGMQVVGPFEPHGLSMSASRAKIFVCQPNAATEERPCAERIARHLATQAFRRPVTDDDLATLMKFYEIGRAEAGGFDSGVTELVTAVLSSPDFLYRAIAPSSSAQESRLLSDLELASRLSFFLWNQGPDGTLIQLATEKKLAGAAVMQAQVLRMLKDPRANSLVENFALAWLNLDELDQIEPLDPTFTAGMRTNFETEIRLFLSSVMLENRSVLDLLTADYTFVNEALARQYDILGVRGTQFRRVTLQNENRWGLLGKGAMLLRTSYGDRTSPVLRGAWVLDRIVGTPPTPPPPNVETDLSVRAGEKPTTVRARLEQHRTNPSCNGCHGLIDPPGLALENFDVTGKWRDVDAAAKAPIDATSTMTNGAVLRNPSDLRRYLTSREDQFPTTVARRLMMYALNREVEYFDMPQVRQIIKNAATDNYRFATIVTGIVNSDAFRRQGAAESHATRTAAR
jgi:mono/diheme cytochrome c family protein